MVHVDPFEVGTQHVFTALTSICNFRFMVSVGNIVCVPRSWSPVSCTCPPLPSSNSIFKGYIPCMCVRVCVRARACVCVLEKEKLMCMCRVISGFEKQALALPGFPLWHHEVGGSVSLEDDDRGQALLMGHWRGVEARHRPGTHTLIH